MPPKGTVQCMKCGNLVEHHFHALQKNKRGEWLPAIPLPYYGLKKECSCGKKFWQEKNYEAHYALEHIILGKYLA